MLSDSQKKLVQRINKNLEYGDINSIAEATGMTRVYVGSVLNVKTRTYNDEIINAAIEIIAVREQGRLETLKKLPA